MCIKVFANRADAEIGRAGIAGGGAGSAGSRGVARERREEGGVGEASQGTDHGLFRMGDTGTMHGRAANAGHYVQTRPWKSLRRKIPKAVLRFIGGSQWLQMKCV